LSSGGDYKRILFIGFDAGQGWMLRGFFIEAVGFSLVPTEGGYFDYMQLHKFYFQGMMRPLLQTKVWKFL